MTITGSLSAKEVLQGIALHLVTLPFMSIKGLSRYVGLIMIDTSYFDKDPRFDTYMFFLSCCERLHRLGLVCSN